MGEGDAVSQGDAGSSRALWDREAAAFDDEPDHGLRDPSVRAAWARLLADALGAAPLRVADLGCGTGSLSLLLHRVGHEVTGLDLSSEMLARARSKAGGAVRFVEGDASDPDLPSSAFDVVLCRHVLWALPDATSALARWAALLVPGGRVVLVEGRWHTGAGLTAEQVRLALPSELRWLGSRSLSADEALWGGPVVDERFLAVARRA